MLLVQHPTVILFTLVASPYASSLIFITGDHSNRLQFVPRKGTVLCRYKRNLGKRFVRYRIVKLHAERQEAGARSPRGIHARSLAQWILEGLERCSGEITVFCYPSACLIFKHNGIVGIGISIV